MRIQHNIMAMNAYRNYNTNTSALSKNLEKLSSGYKINRAGDDAAGLAISEKMRAQITGLNAAQKNVKDGISLVKTAEGAMQEIQDMLNRMDYLATQSANGTYDNEVDRLNLNKEMDALKSEIDRIADSANFNGIKLLDGSLDSDAAAKAAKAVEDAEKALAAANAQSAPAVATKQDVKELISAGETTDSTKVGTMTVVEVDAKDSTDPGFKISFDGVNHIHTGGTKKLTLDIGGKTVDLVEGTELTGAKGDKFTGAQIAEAFKTKMLNGGTEWADKDGNKYSVEVEGDTLKFIAKDNQSTKPNRHMTVKLTTDATPENVKATPGSWEAGTYAAGTTTGDGTLANSSVTVATKIGGQTVNFTKADLTGKETAAELVEALGNITATVGTETKKLSDFFEVTQDTGKITFTSKTTGAQSDSVTGFTFTAGTANPGTGAATAAAWTAAVDGGGDPTTWTAGVDSYVTGLSGYVNHGTEEVVVSTGYVGDQLASTTLDLTGKLKDGTVITLGKDGEAGGVKKYVIAVGDDSGYANPTDGSIAVKVKAGATEEEIASALSVAAADNGTFTISHEGTTAKIGLKQLQGAKAATDMTTRDKVAGYIGVSVVTDEAAAAAKEEAIKKAEEKLAAAQKAAEGKDGKDLTLQIGDTSDKFNQLGVKVGDMHVTAMGTGKAIVDGKEVEVTKTIAEIDIKSLDNAHEAINVIKNAINYVSSIRGDLGAVQNRLEHTANNLSVMAENIQDAESTIRDTDVAEEMMAYTKNNILVQSAQAMLAQANAVPQGVLQLLG